MYVLTAKQIRDWDQYTIQHEPVSSIDLMERAATVCTNWILAEYGDKRGFTVYCGPGNNGGDGLAIARILAQSGCTVSVYILGSEKYSNDHQVNLARLKPGGINAIHFIHSEQDFPFIEHSVIIDALFGTGLNMPLQGMAARVVEHINRSGMQVISVDLPSGLFADKSTGRNPVVKASDTLSFQCYKKALLMQENAAVVGTVHLLDIGLHPAYPATIKIKSQLITPSLITPLFKKRNRFAHKGMFGHSLLVAGSYGKMGAAILAARACLHSGTGLLTCYLPRCGYAIMQSTVPEAMVLTDSNEDHLSELPSEIEKYSAIGIGPGIGTADDTQRLVSFLVRRYRNPLVIDADGLNCLALQKDLLVQLPPLSVLTPHPKEFDRLFGEHSNDFDRADTALKKAIELHLIIVLKSHHTIIACPDGYQFFNSTGNVGMAKGGSGDVLTGIITSFISQDYHPVHAAVLSVYIHGLAGDFAAAALSLESMTAGDLIQNLYKCFRKIAGQTA